MPRARRAGVQQATATTKRPASQVLQAVAKAGNVSKTSLVHKIAAIVVKTVRARTGSPCDGALMRILVVSCIQDRGHCGQMPCTRVVMRPVGGEDVHACGLWHTRL